MNTSSRRNQWQPALACALLVLATLAVYWPVRQFDFINYDDPDYVTENSHVRHGLTWTGVAWAFRTGHAANWHPLTWLSHMLDVHLFGLRPGPHHLVNLGFHIANALLLFLLLRRMTRALWRSAFVAALFALHPLHVESVAWVSERKDVLSTFFGLLALWAYARYAQKPKVQPAATARQRGESPKSDVQRSTFNVQRSKFKVRPPASPSSILHPPSSLFYLLSLLLFALSLLSKPMLVTLPFLLLLLDYWPLGRWQPGPGAWRSARRLFVEKTPFLLFSALLSVATLTVQQAAMLYRGELGFPSRAANAVISCVRYLGKTFWPQDLAVFYPHPLHWPAPAVAGSALVVVLVSGLVLWQWRRRPYLPVGWFWFLGLLVPVLGLVQVGLQAMADRYTYLPLVGVFILLAWGGAERLAACRTPARARIAAAVLLLFLCAGLTRAQLPVWRNTEAIFTHASTVTRNNYVAHHLLGVALADQGKPAEAQVKFAAALRIKPNYAPALSDMAKLRYNEGQFDAAEALLRQVLASNPSDALAHSNLAITLTRLGKPWEALPHHRKAILLKPSSSEALNNFAWLLATHPKAEFRNGPEAVSMAECACRLTEETNIWIVSTLAAAFAEAGRFAEAVVTQQKVCELAAAQGQTNQVGAFQRRLDLYRSRQPYHEP